MEEKISKKYDDVAESRYPWGLKVRDKQSLLSKGG